MSAGRIMAYLVEIDLLGPDDTPATLYLSDLPMRPWPSTDPDRPSRVYDSGRVLEAPSVSVDVFADAARLVGSLGTGRLVVSNADGLFNGYRGHAFQAIRVWWGEIKPDTEPRVFSDDFRLVLTGRAETPQWDVGNGKASRLTIPIYDKRLELEVDIQDTTFAGDNVGPIGYEGGPSDLKGKPKPLSLGNLVTANIPLLFVNPDPQAGQLHDGEIDTFSEIYDRGQAAGLTSDGDLSGAAFDAATPVIEHYVTDLGRGLVKMQQAFGGVVTVGFKGAVDLTPSLGYVETAPELIQALITREDPAAVFDDSFAEIDADAVVGLYISDPTKTRTVIEDLARSLPGWVLPDPLGTWRIGKLRLPAGAPSRTITEYDVIAIERGDPEISTPVWSVTVRGVRYYQTHDRQQLAAALFDTEDEQRLAQEWRQATASDTALRDRWYPNVRAVSIDTACRDTADLQTIADLLFEVTSVRADGTPFEEWKVTVELDEEWLDLLASPGLGELEIRLDYAPEAIDRSMIVMGAAPGRPRGNQITFRVWG